MTPTEWSNIPIYVEPKFQQLLDNNVPKIDIMHGELKNRLQEAQSEYEKAALIEAENDYSDAMESMERKYWEGYYDALVGCYGLTYDISFAEGIVKENEKDGH